MRSISATACSSARWKPVFSAPGTGLVWARHVCHTLIHEADRSRSDEVDDVDEPATLVVDALLRGVGQQGSPLSP